MTPPIGHIEYCSNCRAMKVMGEPCKHCNGQYALNSARDAVIAAVAEQCNALDALQVNTKPEKILHLHSVFAMNCVLVRAKHRALRALEGK